MTVPHPSGAAPAHPGSRVPNPGRTACLVAAALIAGACGGGNAPDMQDSGADSAGPAGPGLAGVLKDDTGNPLGNEMVLACMATVCLFGATEADGSFVFPIDPPAEVALKTPENLSGTPRRGAALCPVRITDSNLVNAGTLYVPSLPQGVPFGAAGADPQTLAVGDDLELTLNRADLTPRLGDVLVDAAARRVPADQVCPFIAPAGEEVLAVYALHPFAATSASPIAVRAPSDLPAGTAVTLRTISEIDGRLSEPVPGHADGSFVTTDPSAGITELTWLVISQ